MHGGSTRFVISSVVARARSLVRGVSGRAALEADMSEEFRHHLELRTEDLIRRGLTPAEAARRARIEFGHVETHRESARASRGLRFLDGLNVSRLDMKLGARMLVKYPGLSVVSVIGMAVAVAIGAGAFGAIEAATDPTLPLHEGERLVSVQNNTTNPGNPDRQSLHDFVLWRTELKTIQDLAAFVTDSRTLVTQRGPELVRISAMTASGFRAARVAPVLGRPLIDDDEREGAPPVVVIAAEEWQRRFDGDPGIIGRPVRLGSTMHTVVGVMPVGFRFPINHRYWVALQLDPTDHEVGAGPAIQMFGRLTQGVSLEEAQTELATFGRRMAAAYPATHAGLRPRVLRYTHPFFDVDSPGMKLALYAIQLAISMLLVVVAVNVAILIYARTATRTGEIAVRSALGASRKRIVTQLFVEALVLSGTAAMLGLTIAAAGLAIAQNFLELATNEQLPFWFELGLSPGLALYVVGLAVLAAVIVGVVPALKATGRRVQAGLQQLSTRGSQMQLGRTWTALIVAQVAIAVAALPFVTYIAGQSLGRATADAGYAADEILHAGLSIEREETPPAAEAESYGRAIEARFAERAGELLRRLEAEPVVAGVTFGRDFPGRGTYAGYEVDRGGPTTDAAPTRATQSPIGTAVTNDVDVDLFSVYDVPIISGRNFTDADGLAGSNTVIVDRVFAERIGGGDVVGRRVRRLTWNRDDPDHPDRGPWLEIVGVVPDFTIQPDFETAIPELYHPVTRAQGSWMAIALRIREAAAAEFAPRVREIAAAVDPALQLHELRTAAAAQQEVQRSLLFIGVGVVVVAVSVLLLSAAGIYAMMSFTVARRRREIGIRAALGAGPRRVLAAVFARASAQLGAGVLTGLVFAAVLDRAMGGGPLVGKGVILLPLVAGFMMMIGLAAALGPARRGLAVQPTEALREE
jgi:putative ABC transport system permease protein